MSSLGSLNIRIEEFWVFFIIFSDSLNFEKTTELIFVGLVKLHNEENTCNIWIWVLFQKTQKNHIFQKQRGGKERKSFLLSVAAVSVALELSTKFSSQIWSILGYSIGLRRPYTMSLSLATPPVGYSSSYLESLYCLLRYRLIIGVFFESCCLGHFCVMLTFKGSLNLCRPFCIVFLDYTSGHPWSHVSQFPVVRILCSHSPRLSKSFCSALALVDVGIIMALLPTDLIPSTSRHLLGSRLET